MSFNARLRRAVGMTGPRGAAIARTLRTASQIDVYGTALRGGPFEAPPDEPVALEHPIPWELIPLTDAERDRAD